MDNNSQNKHNLENAGNVMGSMYNTNRFNENYERKKGMRVFLVIVILAVIISAVILLVDSRSFPGITIVFAGDDAIAVHKVQTNTWGKSRLSDEFIIEYDYDGYEYQGIDGKAGQVGYVIKDYNAEIVVAQPDVLTVLKDNNYLANITYYLSEYSEDRLLAGEQNWVGTAVRFDYGYKNISRRYYEYIPDNGYVSVINRNISFFEENGPTYTIFDFVQKLAAGEPYKYGKRTYRTDKE